MRRRLSLSVLFISLILAACHGVDENVLARVGTREVWREEFQNYLSSVSGETWEVVDSKVASSLLDQFIEEESVFLWANKTQDKAPTSPEERWTKLRQIVISACGQAPTPSPELIEATLAKKLQQEEPEQVLIRQLLLPDEPTALQARAKLKAGTGFKELSQELSIAPNAARGGALGWVSRGTQPEEIESVIFSLKSKEVSQPVKGPGGYHLFQLLDHRDAGSPSREQIEPEVLRLLSSQAERAHFRSCVKQAQNKIRIVVFPRHLWFEYRGSFKEDFDEE